MPERPGDAETDLLALARIVAQAGASILMRRGRRDGHRSKTDGSPVTDADVACEAFLASRIAALHPGIEVVGEESAPDDGVIPNGDAMVFVDPLDGTRAFMDGRDDFSINVGLVRQGIAVTGVIGAPARHAVYASTLEGGRAIAWRAPVDADGTLGAPVAICVAPPVDADHTIGLTSERHGDAQSDDWLTRHARAGRLGLSSALKFALIAEGSAHAYPRFAPTMAWDTAAGSALLSAAGGCVVKPDGTAFDYRAGRALRNGPFIAFGARILPVDA